MLVPGSNVSTMNVNEMLGYLLGRAKPGETVVTPQER